MTISNDNRLSQMHELLIHCAERVGDGYCIGVLIGPQDDGFTTYDTTTWIELSQQGHLDPKHTFGRPQYLLTPQGWLKALEAAGALQRAETRARGVNLARALKAIVKGRDSHHDGFTDERNLARTTGLPPGWIYNALSANLLNTLFPHDDMTVRLDLRGHVFRVPQTFGMDWRHPL